MGSAHFLLIPLLERWTRAELPLPALAWGLLTASAVAVLLNTVDRATAALAGTTLGVCVTVWLLRPPEVRVTGAAMSATVVTAGMLVMGAVVGMVVLSFGASRPLALGGALALAWVVSLGLYPRALAVLVPRLATGVPQPGTPSEE